MKDKWLDDIRDKMAGFEADEPDGLWAGIESRYQPRPDGGRRRVIWPVLRRWAVAASVVAVVALSCMVFIGDGQPAEAPMAELVRESPVGDVLGKGEMPAESPDVASASLPSVANMKKSLPGLLARNVSVKLPETAAAETTPEGVGEAQTAGDESDDTVVASDEKDSASKDAGNRDKETGADSRNPRMPAIDDENVALPKKTKPSRGHGLSVGVFASGMGTSSGGTSTHKDQFSLSDAPWANPDDSQDDYPVVCSRSVSEAAAVDMQHRQPLRFGLSVSYGISPRLAVESGVVYSRLSSDVSGGDRFRSFTGEQVLHYVGIPLNLKYRLASWRSFDFYASVGVLGEKCVSGRLSYDEARNSSVMVVVVKKSEKLHERQLQWSVNAAGGVEFGLVGNVGLYAEPGISYFFDNGSAIRNIYKDRKLNFNLNLGLRFNF